MHARREPEGQRTRHAQAAGPGPQTLDGPDVARRR
jgi:hypothetical protein